MADKEITDLKITDASNTDRWPEGMSPSAVNNAGRALEGILARWFEDTNGSIISTGTDTIARIAELAYYNNDEAARHTALQTIIQNGCRLLVFGRLGATGFESLSDLELPPELQQICQQVPAEKFRMDISSTELRRAGNL